MTNEVIISWRGISFNSDTSAESGYFLIDIPEGLASPQIRSNQNNKQGQHGITDQISWYGGRSITLTGFIIGSSIAQRKQLEDALVSKFVLDGIQQDFNSSYYSLSVDYINEGAGTYQIDAKVLSGPDFAKESGDGFIRNFIITLRALDPYFSSVTLHEETVTELLVGTTFKLPTILPAQFAPAKYFVGTAVNAGNFACPIIFTISGVSTNPQIANTTNGQIMKINTTLIEGEVIVIDTQLGTIEKDGVDISTLLSDNSVYMKLSPGTNSIELTDDTPADLNAQVLGQWRDAII
jgi:hypothetical protein